VSYVCPECPSASYCLHDQPCLFGCKCPKHYTTVPATVSPEALAALETRLAECEKRLETMYRAHQADRRWIDSEVARVDRRIGAVEGPLLEHAHGMAEARSLWDAVHADTRKRVTALEKAASARPSRSTGNPPRPARGRSRKVASKTGRKRGGASLPRKRGAGRTRK